MIARADQFARPSQVEIRGALNCLLSMQQDVQLNLSYVHHIKAAADAVRRGRMAAVFVTITKGIASAATNLFGVLRLRCPRLIPVRGPELSEMDAEMFLLHLERSIRLAIAYCDERLHAFGKR